MLNSIFTEFYAFAPDFPECPPTAWTEINGLLERYKINEFDELVGFAISRDLFERARDFIEIRRPYDPVADEEPIAATDFDPPFNSSPR